MNVVKSLLFLFLFGIGSFTFGQKFKVLRGHKSDVNSVCFSKDGRYLFSGSSDRQIFVWDIQAMDTVRVLSGHTASVNSLSLSPDGDLLLSGSSDRTVKVWNWQTGSCLYTFEGFKDAVEEVCFSPKGNTVAACSRDNSIQIWTFPEKWQEEFRKHRNSVYSLCFSPDGKYLATAGADNTWRLLEPDAGVEKMSVKGHYNTIRSIQFSPNGNFVLTGGLDGNTYLWDVRSGALLRTFPKQSDIVRHVSFSPDGQVVAICSRNPVVTLCNTQRGSIVATLTGHSGSLWQAVFSPDATLLATASADKTIRLWDISYLGIVPYPFDPQLPSPSVTVNVDVDIPETGKKDINKFALVIGNESYASAQPQLAPEMDVLYAQQDAVIFRQYAEKRLGVPAQNIIFVLDGTATQMQQAIEKTQRILAQSDGKAEIYFYYAGHGVPHIETKESYLLPVDVPANQPDERFRVSLVLEKLTQNPHKRFTAFIDACFAGGARNASPLAARGIKILPKPLQLSGNSVLFAACSPSQISLPYPEAKHGLFTYFLLKSLKQHPETISYEKLFLEVKQETALHSILFRSIEQEPTAISSKVAEEAWKNWEFE
ncbi:MAG: caspase family protein [Bacteroidia bacterium]|nr:caspase family protein [Bacteroidia bacterium]